MATHKNLSELFTAIADAIREKTGSTDPIVADDFPEAILAIQTGPSGPFTVLITADNIQNYFTVTNSSYYFKGSGTVFTTNNYHESSTTAKTVLTAKFDMDVSFTYSYSSESRWDTFTLTVGSTTVVNEASGSTTSSQYSGSIIAGTTITFTYSKDSSSHSNDDECTFSNMMVTGYF